MNLKDLVKAIYDTSKEKDVDVGVAASMYGAENNIDTKEAQEFIHTNYEALCKAYSSEDTSLWDECFKEIK